MNAANAIKSKRIIELTNGEAGIETKERVYLLDWMNTYKENQAKRGKKDGYQIDITIRILKDYAGERMLMDQIDKTFCQNYLDLPSVRIPFQRQTSVELHTSYLLPGIERSLGGGCQGRDDHSRILVRIHLRFSCWEKLED